MILFVLRAGKPGDLDFVLASWVESDRHSPLGEDAGRAVHVREHRALALKLLKSEVARLRVACDQSDEDAILGWSLTRDSLVDYVYVKRPARRLGIARALLEHLPAVPCEYTHRPVTRDLPIPSSWTYVPITYRR